MGGIGRDWSSTTLDIDGQDNSLSSSKSVGEGVSWGVAKASSSPDTTVKVREGREDEASLVVRLLTVLMVG